MSDIRVDEKPPLTVSHIFGEIVWLMTQSSRHNGLAIGELSWMLMPAIAARQFHLFYDGERPVGVAIWAMLDAINEQYLLDGEFHPPKATAAGWTSGDHCWLIDLIAPFADDANKQADVMFADLVTGILKSISFKMLKIDPVTGEKLVVPVDPGLGDRLVDQLKRVNL